MGSGYACISPMCVIRSCTRLWEVAQLSARGFDSEMAYRLLKEYLGMSHWWRRKQELILVAIWVVLILSHLVYTLRDRMAEASNCDTCEVSVPWYGGSAAPARSISNSSFKRAVSWQACVRAHVSCGRCPKWSLRATSWLPDLPRQRPGNAPAAPRPRAHKPITRVCGRPGCSSRGAKRPSRPRQSELPRPKPLSCITPNGSHLIHF
jgi:hypothetical protein